MGYLRPTAIIVTGEYGDHAERANLHPTQRMRLSPTGEIRALTRLIEQHTPEASGLWPQIGRNFTMIETANIEIIEASVKVENGASINLDEDTSRRLYALAWEKFEEALVNANALYNETPDGQNHHFNRTKRMLWEVDDLKRCIDVIYSMTLLPDELVEDDEA